MKAQASDNSSHATSEGEWRTQQVTLARARGANVVGACLHASQALPRESSPMVWRRASATCSTGPGSALDTAADVRDRQGYRVLLQGGRVCRP